MCGRFVLATTIKQLKEQFNIAIQATLPIGYNIAPTEQVLCLKQANSTLEAVSMKWGFTFKTSGAKKSIPVFNARMESVTEKPLFKHSFKQRRCLIIMNGFFEWQKTNSIKQPYYITSSNQQLLAVAGIWTLEKETSHLACCLLTAPASTSLNKIHDRMPWILNQEQQQFWLQNELFDLTHLELMRQMEKPLPLSYFPVSTQVNNSRYKAQDTINPL